MQAGKALEFCKQGLMRSSGGSSEDHNANQTVDSKIWAHEVSGEKEDSIGNWTTGHSCYILAKKLSIFCSGSENFYKTKFKDDGLINLMEERSKQYSIQECHGYCWQLLAMFTLIIRSIKQS